jgi:hypothetical protein
VKIERLKFFVHNIRLQNQQTRKVKQFSLKYISDCVSSKNSSIHFFSSSLSSFSDHKSMLKDSEIDKLWADPNMLGGDLKLDNTIDDSDATKLENSEVNKTEDVRIYKVL